MSDGARHALIVAAMMSFYLSAPAASMPVALPAARLLLNDMGGLAKPTMAVLRTRRALERYVDDTSPATVSRTRTTSPRAVPPRFANRLVTKREPTPSAAEP